MGVKERGWEVEIGYVETDGNFAEGGGNLNCWNG